ncbi:aspartate/glutamate racemase family protein [Undibacterium sp. Di26W]|uniref:aspartate/glutamate racemase family protein n=1 Tax=Undibacterium sp. Di26W TaxID=3413035 RepID=UPI003BF0CA40
MQHELAFLHTSPVHGASFEALVQEMAPGLKVHHQVIPSLLTAAQQLGLADVSVIRDVEHAMQEAAASGARMVVCTCSSIGAVAERMAGHTGFQTARIDRAMADSAATLGPRILLVAALETSLLPSTELLMESAHVLGKPVSISNLLVSDAWAHFLQGDSDAYVQAISKAVRIKMLEQAADVDVIVLAQASMAAAALALSDIDKPVLSSPRLGVARAIGFLQHR